MLTVQHFEHVETGDWLHVEFPGGGQVAGTVERGEMFLWIRPEEGCSSVDVVALHNETSHVSRIIEHRPASLTPEVGDEFTVRDWSSYTWPVGLTRLDVDRGGISLRGYSVDGAWPRLVNTTEFLLLDDIVTVTELPTGTEYVRL